MSAMLIIDLENATRETVVALKAMRTRWPDLYILASCEKMDVWRDFFDTDSLLINLVSRPLGVWALHRAIRNVLTTPSSDDSVINSYKGIANV